MGESQRKTNPWWMLAALFALGAPAAGCGSLTDDRCDSVCKCENCGERERSECEDNANAAIDVADAYECYSLLEPYYECQLQKHECQDGHYQDDNNECGHQLDQYNECLKAKSSRDQGPYTPSGD